MSMSSVVVAPGLVLDETLYELSAAGVLHYAPDLAPLTWETFTTPRRWWIIPDTDCRGYKAELTLHTDPARTIRLNRWYSPDLRGGQQPRPHSHPWPFDAWILTGGYTEDRYEPTGDQITGEPAVRAQLGIEHRAGGHNTVPRSVYHEVTHIHEPGRTLSLMVCGAGEPAAWGYLDTTTARHTPTAPDPDFDAKLRHLNPHQY
ncbi:hypothetical protein [Nocardia wallacei]|uniref:hypothetical protein n=1 Tax=Nocardia wallacei TaxID=480035 RepID=UPI0024544815|nr:hypothetical protein [Nocardia wallacei]